MSIVSRQVFPYAKYFVPVLLVLIFLAGTSISIALPVGGIVNIKPKIEVRAAKKKKWTVAGERYALAYGDYIRTDKNGKADILFNNGTEIVMRGNTQIQVVAPASADKPLVVRVFGALSEIFVRAKGNTIIQTAASNAAVRGTQFLISLPSEESTTLTVTEGVVDFYNPHGKVTVREQQQSTATVGHAPTSPIAVDVTGLLTWTADIASLPVELEMPMLGLSPGALAIQRQQGEARVRANAADGEAHRQLARVYYDSWRYADAIREFGEVIRLAPNDGTAYTEYGTALRAAGDRVQATQAFTQALAVSPNNAAARQGLALIAIAAGDYTTARAHLAAVPDDANAKTILGLLELHDGHPELAVQQLTAAVAQDANSYQAQSVLALAQLTLNQLPQAEEAARKAIAVQPNSAQAQSTLALVLFFEHKTDEAMTAATHATRLNPLSPFSLLTQGRMLLAQAKVDEARNVFQQAQALAPDLPLVSTELGQVYLRLGLVPKAEDAFRRALASRVISPDAYAGLGACLQLQGRTQDAITEYRRALAIDPKHASAHVGLAAIYTEQGQLADAEQELRQGIADQPEHGLLYARLAVILLYRQQIFPAQLYAQRAVALLPNSAVAHFILGQVYQEQGRTVQAGDQFRLAATLDPQYAPARYALGTIRESAESGVDLLQPLGLISAANIGSPGQSLNLQNLQSPGADDRIQAAIADPTVIRVASRTYGDTQIDGAMGEDDTEKASLSYIHEAENRHSAVNLFGKHQATDGVRTNADSSSNQVGLSGGWKSWNTPSGLFAMAQFLHTDQGNDVQPTSTPFAASSRTRGELPSVLVGGNIQSSASQRTSALIQLEKPWLKTTDMGGFTALDLDSAHGEIRHDIMLRQHRISLGFNTGSRDLCTDSLLSFGPFFPEIRSTNQYTLHWNQAYVHDTMAIQPNLSATGGLYYNRLTADSTDTFVSPPPAMSMSRHGASEVVLPSVLLAWQPTPRDGIRIRGRGVAGGIDDFQLLNPTEAFLFDTSDLPAIGVTNNIFDTIGRGHSYEAEYDHTFRDSSFLRIGALDQGVRNTKNAAGEFLTKSTYRSFNMRLEKVLSPTVTGIVGVNLIDARAITSISGSLYSPNAEISGIPRYKGELGIEYHNQRGWFLQDAVALIGPRMEPYPYNASMPRLRDDAFIINNMRIGKRTGLRSTIYLEVYNLFDERFSVMSSGFNQVQPGRQFRLGISQRF